MKENKFQKKVIEALEAKCAFIINLHGHLMQKSGLPDLEVVHRSWHGFLELKVGDNEASDIQRAVAAKILKRDVPCYVLRCVCLSHFNCYGLEYKYIPCVIENFNGTVIAEIGKLDKLLTKLVSLEIEKGAANE